jgi:hypothetical protein
MTKLLLKRIHADCGRGTAARHLAANHSRPGGAERNHRLVRH